MITRHSWILPRLDYQTSALKFQNAAAICVGILGRIMSLGITRHTGGVFLRASGAALGLWLAAQVTVLVSQAMEPGPDQTEEQRSTLPDRTTTSSVVASNQQWTAVPRPVAVFTLASPEIEGLGIAHSARRHSSGEREDTLAFGQFSSAASFMQLTIARNRTDTTQTATFIVDTVRQTARVGLSAEKMTISSAVTTKFGMLETADGVLSAGDKQRSCLLFRFSETPSPVRLSGWLCGAAPRPADRQQLACLIDRLHLVGSGEDRELRATFTNAELRRDPRCNPPRLAATGRKTSWLDADGKAPALRGGNAGTPTR
jgi:hypothetical protein